MFRTARPLGISLALALAAAPAAGQTAGDAPIAIAVDTRTQGPKIDRNVFGQFAEHLGTGIYGGVWVGKDSPIPNVRGIRSDVVAALQGDQGAQRALARRLLRRRISLARRHRPGAERAASRSTPTGAARSSPTRFGTDEFFDFVDQIGSRGLCLGQRRVRHGRGSRRLARIYDRRQPDDRRQGARRQRPSGAVQGQVSGHRQRELGLRRQRCRPDIMSRR